MFEAQRVEVLPRVLQGLVLRDALLGLVLDELGSAEVARIQGQREAAPLAGLAGHGDVATEDVREAARDREPETRSPGFARHRTVDLTEGLEQVLEIVGLDPAPRILHREADVTLVPFVEAAQEAEELAARG